jgi:hypothetical protein
MKEENVFAQAEALWRPQAERLRSNYEKKRWSQTIAGRPYLSSPQVERAGLIASDELAVRATAILTSLQDAHAVGKKIRNGACSVETFSAWCTARLREEADTLRGLWPIMPGTPWADTRNAYVAEVDRSEDREKRALDSQITQYFGTQTQSPIGHYGLLIFGQLKGVNPLWWFLLIAWFALALGSAESNLRSVWDHTWSQVQHPSR